MDRQATLAPTPAATRSNDVRVPSHAMALAWDDPSVEPSAEPPVQYPLDDEERNLIDLVEEELVIED